MPRKSHQLHLAVGSDVGALSASWKFYVQGDDAYISARALGSAAKFSLHKSGKWRFALAENANPYKNEDRKWFDWQPAAVGGAARIGPAIIVPSFNPPTPLLGGAPHDLRWIPGPPSGAKLVLGSYVVSDYSRFRSLTNVTGLRIERSMPLRTLGQFVVTSAIVALDAEEEKVAVDKVRAMRISVTPGSDTTQLDARVFDIRWGPGNGGSSGEPVVWDLGLTEENFHVDNSAD